MEKHTTSQIIVYKMILTALFAALSFIGLYIKIPVSTGAFVHMGNFFCILGSLLCGGLVGGFAGALGMTLGDVLGGYLWTTWLRTLIVKFLMGFVSGTLFRAAVRRKWNTAALTVATFFISALSLLYCLLMLFSETYDYTYVVVICTGILTVVSLFALIFQAKLKPVLKAVLFSILIGILVNTVGEFILRIVFAMAIGTTYAAALTKAVMSVPAALINGVLTILFITLIYYPLYRATRSINRLNDLSDYIEIGPQENIHATEKEDPEEDSEDDTKEDF